MSVNSSPSSARRGENFQYGDLVTNQRRRRSNSELSFRFPLNLRRNSSQPSIAEKTIQRQQRHIHRDGVVCSISHRLVNECCSASLRNRRTTCCLGLMLKNNTDSQIEQLQPESCFVNSSKLQPALDKLVRINSVLRNHAKIVLRRVVELILEPRVKRWGSTNAIVLKFPIISSPKTSYYKLMHDYQSETIVPLSTCYATCKFSSKQ